MRMVVAHPADPTSPVLGGAVRWAVNVAMSLSDRGHMVTFVGYQSAQEDSTSSVRIPFGFIPMYTGSCDWRVYLLNLFMKIPFMRLPSDAVVLTHRLDVMLAFVLFMPDNPKIMVSTAPLYAARKHWRTWFPLIYRLYRVAERHVLPRIDLLAIMDETTRQHYVGMREYKPGKLRWTWTAVDTNAFKPLDRDDKPGFGIDASKTTIAFAGRLDRVKNLGFLLRAYSLLEARDSSTQLVFFGDGPDKQELLHLADQLGLESVVFAGPVSPAEMPLVLNCVDLVVLTAVGGEGSPTILKEALACGVPVVAMNSGDVEKFISHPLTGKVVDVLDEETFAHAITDVIALRAHSGSHVAAACRSTALTYSVEALGTHWEELCTEAIIRRTHQ
jgi:glycosyltransferase involved in cell wall biosynthesis